MNTVSSAEMESDSEDPTSGCTDVPDHPYALATAEKFLAATFAAFLAKS